MSLTQVFSLLVPTLLFAAWAAHLFVVARRSASWPTADATIVVSRVEGRSNMTRARIEFAYVVDGRRHVGRRIAVGPAVETTGDGAERIVADHPVGSHVVIAFDPRDPSYGVLRRGVRARHVVFALAAALALVMTFGVAVVLATLRQTN